MQFSFLAESTLKYYINMSYVMVLTFLQIQQKEIMYICQILCLQMSSYHFDIISTAWDGDNGEWPSYNT